MPNYGVNLTFAYGVCATTPCSWEIQLYIYKVINHTSQMNKIVYVKAVTFNPEHQVCQKPETEQKTRSTFHV